MWINQFFEIKRINEIFFFFTWEELVSTILEFDQRILIFVNFKIFEKL